MERGRWSRPQTVVERLDLVGPDRREQLLVVQLVKNPPAMQESWVRSLGWEDPLEEEMATHSSTPLPRDFHEQRSWAGYSPWDCKESDTTV